MQYILTEEEWRVNAQALQNTASMRDAIIADLCQRVADNEPMHRSWVTDPNYIEPWGCIRSAEHDAPCNYCDECPVLKICTWKHKKFSK